MPSYVETRPHEDSPDVVIVISLAMPLPSFVEKIPVAPFAFDVI